MNFQPVGPDMLLQNAAHRIRQINHLPDPLGHSLDAVFRQLQPVQHDRGDAAIGLLHIQGIGCQNIRGISLQTLGHSQKPLVLFAFRQPGDDPLRVPGLFQQFHHS